MKCAMFYPLGLVGISCKSVCKRILVHFNVFISLVQQQLLALCLVKISTEKGDIKNMLSLCNEDSISITLALAWPALAKVIHIQVYFMRYNVSSRGRICVHQLRDNPLVIVISTYIPLHMPCLTPYNCTKVSLQKLLTVVLIKVNVFQEGQKNR